MTDAQTPATTTDETEVTAVGAVETDGAYTLFVADFSDTETAWKTYEALKSIEDGATVKIEGVLVVRCDANGKLDIQKATDHSTKTGLKWGVVGGVVLGVIFPPSILASAATLGAAGATMGKIRQLHHRIELGKELEGAIEPGHSGILALVSDPGVVEIRNAMAAANHIVEAAVSDVAARDMKAAAKEAQDAEPATEAEATEATEGDAAKA